MIKMSDGFHEITRNFDDASPFHSQDERRILEVVSRCAVVAVAGDWVRRFHEEEVITRLPLQPDLKDEFEAASGAGTLGVNLFERQSINDRQRWRGGLHLGNMVAQPHRATEVIMYERYGEEPGRLIFGHSRIRQTDAQLVAAGMDQIRLWARLLDVRLDRNGVIPGVGPRPPAKWD